MSGDSESHDHADAHGRSLFRKMLIFGGSSWLRLIITFIVGLILMPVLIEHMGVYLVGLFLLVSLTVAAADPVETTLKRALTRELTLAVSSNDPERMRRTFTNGVALAAMGSCVTFAISALLALFAPALFTVSPEHARAFQLAIACEGLAIGCMTLLAPWRNLYIAQQRIVNDNASQTIARSLDLISALLAFHLLPWDPFVSFVVTRTALRLWQLFFRSAVIHFQTPDARFTRSRLDRRLIKEMAGVGGWSAGNQIASLGLYAFDHFILNIFKGAVFNGLYGVIMQILGYSRMLGANMTSGVDVLAADLQHRGHHVRLGPLLLRVTAHTYAVNGFCGAVAAAFAGPLIQVWLGKQLSTDDALLDVMSYDQAVHFAWVYIAVLIPGFVLSETHLASSSVLYGMGLVKRYAPVLIGVSVLRVAVAIGLMLAGMPPIALAWCSFFFFLVAFGAFFPWLTADVAGAPFRRVLWTIYLKPTLSFLPVAGVGAWLATSLGPWTGLAHLPKLAACGLAVGLLWLPLAYFLVLTPEERGHIGGIARRILARLRRA